ncbi:MAG TPA: biopolymer transporter ExbD [Thermoanaerobaculia bacterium]|jgi:biopolymer transport protein ExbD
MSPQSATGGVRSDINVTPLVDVCLVLLIIFMVVMPMIQAGVKVDLPKTAKAPALAQDKNELTVTIQEDGSIWIRGTRTAAGDLEGVLATIHQAEPERDVIVRGDRRLQYERISEVLTTLSDVGYSRIGLVTERKRS